MPYTAEELVGDADTKAANLVLNFLYWSYRRSSATQEMQQTLRNRLARTLSELEGFNHLRHNPERSLQTAPTKDETQGTLLDFPTYERISRTYATCCKTVLDDDTPLPHYIRNRLTTVRNHVRGEISAILATKLMETYGILGYVYDGLQNLYSSFAYLLFKSGGEDERAPSMFATLWTYMPSFLINVMYQFEDKHLELREELCDVLLEDIRISDELWKEIESIRSYVYKTLYTQVYHYLDANYDDASIFIERFSNTEETTYLPDPYTMSHSTKDSCA